MKCQFHFLTHVDDGGLQMYSDNFFFDIYSREFRMFFQIFVPKGDTRQFFGETRAYEQYNHFAKNEVLH